MRFAILALLVLVAGCASQATAPSSSSERQPARGGPISPPQGKKPESVAVASILQNAHAEAASGQLASAAASIERALRIEPRNPRLWNELARVRLQQGAYAQAAATAERSDSLAGDDADLRASNADIIERARRGQGR